MSLFRDNSRAFDKRLRLVASVVDLDPTIQTLRTQMGEFQRAAGQPVLDRLTDAVVDGQTDVDVLFAAALAEAAATPPTHNAVITGVRERIHRRIRDCYAQTAVDTYKAVGAQFDAVAKKLTAAHGAVDLEASAEEMIERPDKDRKLWSQAMALADDLTRLMPVVVAAAALAGISDDSDEAALALCVDAADVARRDVWAAWEIEDTEAKAARTAANHLPFSDTMTMPTPSRCGRWSALLRAGAVLRAHPANEEFTPYRRPKQMLEQIRDGKRVMVDPESPDYQPPQHPTFTAPPRSRIRVS